MKNKKFEMQKCLCCGKLIHTYKIDDLCKKCAIQYKKGKIKYTIQKVEA